MFRIFRPSRPAVFHNTAETTQLDTIADNTDFTREGSGETVINGSVGQKATLTIREAAKVRIIGNISRGCSILKEGSGTLKIEGTVADDLKLTVYGTGTISFTQRPPEFVIQTIKNRGGSAKIICGSAEVPQQVSQGYVHHNLGVFAQQAEREPQPRSTPPVRQAPPPPVLQAPHAPSVLHETEPVDQYDPFTELYIDNYRRTHTKTIKERIEELNLTPEEEGLFEKYTDCIFGAYFEDVPVMFHDQYYDLHTLLELHKHSKPDPFTRLALKLIHIQSARPLLEELDKAIEELKKQRAVAKEGDEEQPIADLSISY